MREPLALVALIANTTESRPPDRSAPRGSVTVSETGTPARARARTRPRRNVLVWRGSPGVDRHTAVTLPVRTSLAAWSQRTVSDSFPADETRAARSVIRQDGFAWCRAGAVIPDPGDVLPLPGGVLPLPGGVLPLPGGGVPPAVPGGGLPPAPEDRLARNVAVTARSMLICTEHRPVPEHPPPLQPANVKPLPGVAIRLTFEPGR